MSATFGLSEPSLVHAQVSGVVERGDARGRTIGFPTANMAIPEGAGLNDGVYAGWFGMSTGARYAAAINIGRRPTFYAENGLRLLESHLLDFDGDLYGCRATVTIAARVRDERRFDGIEALVAQLREDCSNVRRLLGLG